MAVPKYVGRDCELSTTGRRADGRAIDPWEVTQANLHHIDAAFEPLGLQTWSRRASRGNGGGYFSGVYASRYATDCLRHWATNGQCYYSDMSHLEVCTASCLDPRRYAAEAFSTLLVAEAARRGAEEEADGEASYSLAAANVDVLDPGISWGTHASVTVSEDLWEDLFREQRHPAILGYVASAMAAAIPFFGSGYLLPLKDGSTIFSPSGRAHHLSFIKTTSTTEAFRRGLLNARREPHGDGHQRLHLIGFDFNLISAALQCSFVQCALAAAEEGYCGLNLYDPVRALRTWSWNLDLQTGKFTGTARLIDGRELTLPAYMRELASTLLEMCESGLITDRVAPGAKEYLPRIIDLTRYLDEGNIGGCARHLDWAAKLLCLLDLSEHEDVTFGDSVTRLADHDFANTDPDKGRIWTLWDRELIDPLITLADAENCLADGPPESRDWGRGRVIRTFFDDVTDVDWSYVELVRSDARWGRRLRIELPHLDTLNRAQCEPLLGRAFDLTTLERILQDEHHESARQTDPVIDIRRMLAQVVDDDAD